MTLGYVFDPMENTVTPCQLDCLEDYRNAIGCDIIEAVPVGHGHILYVDEMGWPEVGKTPEHFVVPFEVDMKRKTVNGVGHPLAGRAVLVGLNADTGDEVDAALPLNAMMHMFGRGVIAEKVLNETEDEMTGLMQVEPFNFVGSHPSLDDN